MQDSEYKKKYWIFLDCYYLNYSNIEELLSGYKMDFIMTIIMEIWKDSVYYFKGVSL